MTKMNCEVCKTKDTPDSPLYCDAPGGCGKRLCAECCLDSRLYVGLARHCKSCVDKGCGAGMEIFDPNKHVHNGCVTIGDE